MGYPPMTMMGKKEILGRIESEGLQTVMQNSVTSDIELAQHVVKMWTSWVERHPANGWPYLLNCWNEFVRDQRGMALYYPSKCKVCLGTSTPRGVMGGVWCPVCKGQKQIKRLLLRPSTKGF